ncbi:PREDICTED: F-box protein At5g52880 [Tarenaya hassleriana]|uniref:F-box protein At5g52880 n=1 Tax=Tarenaya hassleriana TaxID=28532 RepID=UPI00053C1EB1|nr:PREDICTED: F-box protein At5g52880 [Tarenaya hassleriana]
MATPMERYKKLFVGEALSEIHRYPLVSQELSSILKLGYRRFPKNVQALIFQDTLTAFRLLPDMQTSAAVSAAQLLLKSVEAVLPKQKRNLAIAELKHSKVAMKRHSKTREEEELDSPQLPEDVLRHIFSFLDVASLVSAAQVCRSWNLAAYDNNLWQKKYDLLFKDSSQSLTQKTDIDWRETFKNSYIAENLSKALRSTWGYCWYCDSIVWHNSLRCPKEQCRLKSGGKLVDHISTQQVVEYIMGGLQSNTYSSESESDEESVYGLWAYPKLAF